jgi:hypothetical protein
VVYGLGANPVLKPLVVLCHEEHSGVKGVVCIKATSNTEFYQNSPDLLAGIVCYEPSQLSFLPERTVIQPENGHMVFYQTITEDINKGVFKVMGTMPDDFHARLEAAITNSVRISPKRRDILLEMIHRR